jgi:RHS repeat-associated protein
MSSQAETFVLRPARAGTPSMDFLSAAAGFPPRLPGRSSHGLGLFSFRPRLFLPWSKPVKGWRVIPLLCLLLRGSTGVLASRYEYHRQHDPSPQACLPRLNHPTRESLLKYLNAPVRSYAYGLDLISQQRNTGSGASPAWETSFYGYDGQGSVRFLVPADKELVASVTLSGPRNNWSGWVGLRLQVGATPLVVNSLGRWVLSGNTGAHTVKLVRTDGTDVPGASVSVSTAGAPAGQFKYVNLSQPVTLAANTTYYLVSQEVSGGDYWYDCATTVIPTGDASFTAAMYAASGSTTYLVGAGNNRSYGPVNLMTAVGISATYDYDAYGILLESTGSTPNHYRYTGEQWDADLGMYYLRARYYQPQTGRFWTMDSFEGSQGDPLSLHKYIYCSGNPVNGSDPSGYETEGSQLAACGIWGMLASRSTYAVFQAVKVAARFPKITKLVIGTQTLVTWYGITQNPEEAALYYETGGFAADFALLQSVARDIRGIVAMYKGLNSIKQAQGVAAILTKASLNAGTGPLRSIKPPGYDLLPELNRARGHLHAESLGGPGDVPENLVALYQTANRKMEAYEMEVLRAVKAGEKVKYAAKPVYVEGQVFPTAVIIHAEGDRGYLLDVTIKNVP